MDNRDLSIIIGQALNLAHAEFLADKKHQGSNDEQIKKRVKELVTLSLEVRKELQALRPKMGSKA